MDPKQLAFHAALSQAASAVEDRLDALLPAAETELAAAMRYATLSGGKRLRAFLTLEIAGMFRAPRVPAERVGAAIECIHAYSLIHDDLPCMDDDDLRRGKPTVHKRWDEATAVLAGDALQTLAFEILTGAQTAQDPAIRIKLIRSLAQAGGVFGMVGGQALDIAAETAVSPLSLDEISALQSLKTGALIRCAAEAGALLSRSDPSPFVAYADALGLAFQVQDDILDVTGDAEAAGKRLRKDDAAGKATFVSILGIDGAKRRASELAEEAISHLSPFGLAAENLRQAARFAIQRTS
ncbi:polyprenyl synthetase family protein [Oceanomicrobium pacificus]|uniref:Geranylgeranyl diphosphate synthase n=1 Tax=Oceanomicrobium pacificus TaxID=2692916 RepID=A0A6B0TT30_9RHOB|nr:farnesyl diphosphate synthase [Oceanomicrobium pacificus]MXU64955.1 polyprenyl synthetase family protein [Oceanomicrobium pacificus]